MFLKKRAGENIDAREMFHLLRKAGFTQRTVTGPIKSKVSSRSYWRASIDDAFDMLPSEQSIAERAIKRSGQAAADPESDNGDDAGGLDPDNNDAGGGSLPI